MGLTPSKSRIFANLYAFGAGFFVAGFIATEDLANLIGFIGCAAISGFFYNRGNQ